MKNYDEFNKHITSIKEVCERILNETSKENPNRITISNMLTDKIDKEKNLADRAFYRFGATQNEGNREVWNSKGIGCGELPHGLLECQNGGSISGACNLNIS